MPSDLSTLIRDPALRGLLTLMTSRHLHECWDERCGGVYVTHDEYDAPDGEEDYAHCSNPRCERSHYVSEGCSSCARAYGDFLGFIASSEGRALTESIAWTERAAEGGGGRE